MLRFLALLLLVCGNLFGATYYVATNGNNAADGSLATPWSNVWYAAKTVVAGDIVIVKAGEYNEFVTNTASGSAGNQITFSGERGAGGQWLTIIDPSTPYTNGWVAAPEVGAGVYKQTNMPFATRELTIDHKRVGYVYTNGDASEGIDGAYYSSGLVNGTELLALASNATLTTQMSRQTVSFWDGIEALYVTVDTNTTCLRLRDGSDPNGLNIRLAPNRDALVTSDTLRPTITINDQGYITYSNFLVRGGCAGFFVVGVSAQHNCIVSNHVSGGLAQIVTGTYAHDNLIAGNELTANYYGYTNIGAWEAGTNAPYLTREIMYCLSKFLMGRNSTHDDGVKLANCGSNNIICYNHIFQGLGNGISIDCYVASCPTNNQMFSNAIANEASCGIIFSEGHTKTKVFHNQVNDCNLTFRFHHMDTAGETNRIVYLYRNTGWLPFGIGNHMYMHFSGTSGATYWPEFWVYQNSFSGGETTWTPSGYAAGNGGIPGCRFIDNIFSAAPYIYAEKAFWTNSAMVGAFDYNLITPPVVTYPLLTDPAWYGTNNIKTLAYEWPASPIPDFKPAVGSRAINAALDLTSTFTVSGTNYAALPFGTDVKIGPAWDIGALEGGTVANATTLRVGTLRGP